MNPAFEHLTGYTREELVGRNARVLKSGKGGAAFFQGVRATLSAGEAWSGQVTNRRKDGSVYDAAAVVFPVRGADGRVVNYVAGMHDVTHERQIEDQLRQAQKMEIAGRLAGGVAHDFNNLITVITGRAQLLLRNEGVTPAQRRDIELIRETANHAASLTRQLLAFSRKQPIVPRVLDLNTVIGHMKKMLGRLIGEDIELVITPGAAAGRVKADPGQIEQVVMNLVVNARDAHAERRSHRGDDGQRAPGRRRGAPARGPAARRLRDAGGERQRVRHGRRDPGPRLRAVLHDEGRRQGHRPRPLHRLRHREAERGRHPDRERARGGRDLQDLPAPRRGRARRRGRGGAA